MSFLVFLQCPAQAQALALAGSTQAQHGRDLETIYSNVACKQKALLPSLIKCLDTSGDEVLIPCQRWTGAQDFREAERQGVSRS